MSGGVGAAIFIVERVAGIQLGAPVSGAICVAVGFVVLMVGTWRTWKRADAFCRPPKADIKSFDSVLKPDQRWHILLGDRNRPDHYEVRIELEGGYLWAMMKNDAGEDRTKKKRPVIVRTS